MITGVFLQHKIIMLAISCFANNNLLETVAVQNLCGVKKCKKKPAESGLVEMLQSGSQAACLPDFLRRAMKPTRPRPASSMAYVSGSGTAATGEAKVPVKVE